MKVSEMYPAKWLKAETLAGHTRGVTIETSTVEELYNTREKRTEQKFVLGFFGKQLRLVLNKTQSLTMARITGSDDSDLWIGHQINLSPARTPNGQDTITISAPEHRPAAPAPAAITPKPAPAAPSPAEQPEQPAPTAEEDAAQPDTPE